MSLTTVIIKIKEIFVLSVLEPSTSPLSNRTFFGIIKSVEIFDEIGASALLLSQTIVSRYSVINVITELEVFFLYVQRANFNAEGAYFWEIYGHAYLPSPRTSKTAPAFSVNHDFCVIACGTIRTFT